MSSAPSGLAALDARLAEELAAIEFPAPDWVPPSLGPDGQRVLDVAVVGAGMVGLAVGFGLLREGVRNIACLDAAERGREGPWLTWARMQTLRSPKTLQGPALGVPALTFRAWFTAQWGEPAWAALDKAPRTLWMDYLRWYREATRVPVRNGAAVTAIVPEGALYRLEIAGDAPRFARHVVLATGRDGLGGPYLPPEFRDLPACHVAHSSDLIDFPRLRRREVAVVGAGASAFDNAACALEAGARRVRILVRRSELPRVNAFTAMTHPGFTHGMRAAPAEARLRLLAHAFARQVPPPRDTVQRVARHRNAELRLGSPVHAARMQGGRVLLETATGPVTADFVILGTGFVQDLALRPELAAVTPDIALIGDHVRDGGMFAGHPWLDEAFAFTPRPGHAAPHLARLHCFNFASTPSHGKVSGDIPALSDGVGRLVRGIVGRLFAADLALHEAMLHAFARPELLGDEWPRTIAAE